MYEAAAQAVDWVGAAAKSEVTRVVEGVLDLQHSCKTEGLQVCIDQRM